MQESSNDLQKMQREAEDRIRAMQKRADRAVFGNDMPPVPNFVRTPYRNSHSQNSGNHSVPQPKRQPTEPNKPRAPLPDTEKPQQNISSGLFGRFRGADILKILNFKNIGIDSDVLIIITLILLLSTDDCDQLLILALVYIML